MDVSSADHEAERNVPDVAHCGKAACGKCLCGNTEGEMPIYRAQLDSDLIWCFGAPTMVYHCSTSEIVGLK